jgi:hypothetical protein
MNGEIDIYGIFISPLLAALGLALVLTTLLRRVMLRFGLYRFVWHQALFDFAVLIILLGATSAVLTGLPSPLLH